MPKNLLDQHFDTLHPAIRRVDHAANEVDRREEYLRRAETELHEANRALVEARTAFLNDFPELRETATP